jgi:hypothetical protein
MTFGQARRSFYDAARHGLSAELLWPTERAPSPKVCSPFQLAELLVSHAREGLVSAGVDRNEADHWLDIIRERIGRRRTGARWQRRVYETLVREMPPEKALQEMLRRYRELSDRGSPVAEWRDV